MFSSRFYLMLSLLAKFMHTLGAAPVSFNEKRLLAQYDKTNQKRLRTGFYLGVFWAIASLYLIFKYRKAGDVDRYNLALAYWLFGIFAMEVYAVYFLDMAIRELIRSFNGLIIFLRYMRSKSH